MYINNNNKKHLVTNRFKLLSTYQNYALYIYFFSLNFEMFNISGIGSVAKITAAIYLALLAPDFLKYLNTMFIKRYLVLLLGLWIYLTLVSIININSYSDNFANLTLLLNILLYWILINHERRNPGVLIKGIISFIWGSIILSFLYKLGLGIEIQDNRLTIFGDNPNALALKIGISLVCVLYFVLLNDLKLNKARYFYLLMLPIFISLIRDTGSRKAFIAILISMIIIAVSLKKEHKLNSIFVLIFMIGIAIIFLKISFESETMVKRLISVFEKGDIGGREELWPALIPLVFNRPFFGYGITGYERESIKLFGYVASPHNVFLEIALLGGAVGLIFYGLFVLKISLRAIKIYKESNSILEVLLLVFAFARILGGQALDTKIVWASFALITSDLLKRNHDIYNKRDKVLYKCTT